MKFCRDCTVKLTLKGLEKRKGSVSIPLVKNDGEEVTLTATHADPEVTRDRVLFIGQERGEWVEFEFPGARDNAKAAHLKNAPVDSFDVAITVLFDPAADDKTVKVLDTQLEIRARTTSSLESEICYTSCNGMDHCDVVPNCILCNGLVIYCR